MRQPAPPPPGTRRRNDLPADDPLPTGPDLAALDRQLAEARARHQERDRRDRSARSARRHLWLAHHWPDHYAERCLRVGPVWLCRRCLALYPLALAVAAMSLAGIAPWPDRFDPWLIWSLSVPATVAYVGEAVGWFPYRARWQVLTTLLAALAFGRALGHELADRWQPLFWGPIAVFGGIWFAATLVAWRRRAAAGEPQMAATASSISSTVL